MVKITTFIPVNNKQISITDTTYGPADGTEGYFEWDPSKYDNIVDVFVEIVASSDSTGCVPNQIAGVRWELYDVTNSTQIGYWQDAGTLWEVRRGTDIYSSMPASTATMRISWHKLCGTSATAISTRLIIVQENPTKTRNFIPIGGNQQTASTIYTPLGNVDKQWEWDSSKFSTIDSVEYHCTYRSDTSGRTANVKLDDLGQGGALATFSKSTDTYDLTTSSDISSSISNATTYRSYYKIDDSSAKCEMANAFLVVDLINLSKMLCILDILISGFIDSATSYSEESNFQATYDNSTDFWEDVTKSIYHFACIYMGGRTVTSASSILFDDGSQIANSEVTTTSTTMEIQTSSTFTEPADGSTISYSIKETGGGRGDNAYSSCSYLVIEVSDISSAVVPLRNLMGIGQ